LRVGLGVYVDEPSGLAVGTVDTALALSDAGAEVTLFALTGSHLPPRAQPLADRLIWLPRPSPLLRGRGFSTAFFLASRLAVSRRLAEALHGQRLDALHVFSPGMAAMVPDGWRISTQAWFHPPRLASRLRTMLPFTSTPALYPAALIVQTQAHLSDLAGYRRADLVITNTEVAREAMLRRGFPALCVPPALEVGTEPIVSERSDAFRIAFCSHPLGGRRKGLRFLLEALMLVDHRPLELTLVGGRDRRFDQAIERLRRAEIEVRLPGQMPREDYLQLLLRGTDLLAFPSLYEEWGYALFEALSQGVPALAFNLYPFSEIIDERTGILVRPRDTRALASAINRAAGGELPGPDTVREATRERFGSVAVAARLLEAWA
jgi:glycosyltransferase involved in cell wall biosynthesis